MKLHGGPHLARGPEFDTHALERQEMSFCKIKCVVFIIDFLAEQKLIPQQVFV